MIIKVRYCTHVDRLNLDREILMRKIIVQEFLTLDGVMQAPGGPQEDASGNFKYGGWTAPYFTKINQEASEVMAKWMQSTDVLLGRKTYDIFAGYWPKHTAEWPGIQEVNKYIISNTLAKDVSGWQNVTFINSVDDLKKLKDSDGPDIKVHGSGDLARTLLRHGLVDELCFMIFPITLGSGKRLFSEGAQPASFTLAESFITSNGVIFADYQLAGDVEVGTVGE